MARSAGELVQNNLSRGLVTEATGLNFPDDAVISADNIIFDPTGNAYRRPGLDLENSPILLPYDGGVTRAFFWTTVGLATDLSYVVVQAGSRVHFFRVIDQDSLSTTRESFTISLEGLKTRPNVDTKDYPCIFAAGSGMLFMSHPFLDPVVIEYDNDTNRLTYSSIEIRTRDLEGVEDGLGIEERPATLSTKHYYNLQNQGWNKSVRTGSRNNEI